MVYRPVGPSPANSLASVESAKGLSEMINRYMRVGTGAAILLLLAAIWGCGGGGGGAAARFATVEGQCYDAASPTVAVGRAVVTEMSTGRSTTADAAGNFTLGQLPGGLLTLQVTGPARAAYKQTLVGVQCTVGQVTQVQVGLVPAGVADPAQVTISPRNMTVQTSVSRQFDAVVKDANGNTLPIHPTWTVTNNIGEITRLGVLTARNTTAMPLTGQVMATAGLATDAVPVTADPAGPPVLTNFVLSPLTLGHNGGTVSISAQVEDGDQIADRGTPPGPVLDPERPGQSPSPAGYDGVADIVATVRSRGTGATITILVSLLTTGDARFGHYQTTYSVPANSTSVGPTGDQPAEQYDVYLTATDALGATSAPTSALVLSVHGVAGPPPPAF